MLQCCMLPTAVVHTRRLHRLLRRPLALSTMTMMTADATATHFLLEHVWPLHLPSSLPLYYEGGEEGDAMDVCGPYSGALQMSRHSF